MTFPSTHDQVGASLADHLRARSKPPLVFEEIALAGTYGSAGRLDVAALYIGPGYAGAWIEGYEVKASRADLMRDLDARKWERYRAHGLRRFSFAFPADVAKPSEVPKEAGVIVLRPLEAEGRGDVSEPSWRTVRKGDDWGGGKLPDPGVLLRLLRRSDQEAKQARLERNRLEERRVRVAELLEYDDLQLSWMMSERVRGLAQSVEGRERQLAIRERNVEEREERSRELIEEGRAIEGRMKVAANVLHVAAQAFGRYQPERAAERLERVRQALDD